MGKRMCGDQFAENACLKSVMASAKENFALGMRSHKELALTWLCHEYNVYYANTGRILPDYIEKLALIEKLDDGKHE